MSRVLSMPLKPGRLMWCWHWLKSNPVAFVLGLMLLGLFFPFCFRKYSEWEAVYVTSSRILWSGGDPYQHLEIGYFYPPFAAWAARPFIDLSRFWLRCSWYLINVVSFIVMVGCGWRLAGGKSASLTDEPDRAELASRILGLICGLIFILNCFAHQQVDVLLGGLLLGGCWLLSRSRSLAAATLFGLAAAVKCTPLLWTGYLLWRGRPVAALWLVAVAVGANLLVDVTHPQPTGRLWSGEFYQTFLQPMMQSNHTLGTWGSDPVYNQSLVGAYRRWLPTGERALMPRQFSRLTMLGLEAGLLLLSAWIMGRPFRKLHTRAAGEPVHPESLEYSAVLLLMLLLSPMSSPAHFGTLILPGFCLARWSLQQRSWGLLSLLLLVNLLVLSQCRDLVGSYLHGCFLWMGLPMWSTLLLLAGCLRVRWGQQHAAAASELPQASGTAKSEPVAA